jgi:AhpD family alkylhydroperoxidase
MGSISCINSINAAFIGAFLCKNSYQIKNISRAQLPGGAIHRSACRCWLAHDCPPAFYSSRQTEFFGILVYNAKPYYVITILTFMAEYQDPKDRAYTEALLNAARKESAAFMNLKHTAERKDGAIPVKYRELMSVAVALTTQCAYCIESHIENAVKAGATREEIAETVFIAAALRAGGAVGNGLMAMRLFEEASQAEAP